MKFRNVKKFSASGSRYRYLYDLDKSGYLVHKFIVDKKTGEKKRDKIDFWKDIQDKSMEESLKSKLSNCADQDKIMKMVADYVGNCNHDDIIYDDYTTGKDYVDLLNDYAKLKQAFPNQYGYGDNNFAERVKQYAIARKDFYAKERKYFENLAKVSKNEKGVDNVAK